MIEGWRWYGDDLDRITLGEIRQTGATGIVTALHEIPYGQVWPRATIAQRRDRIRAEGLDWVVCESLPVHEDIKRGTGQLDALFANYRQSLIHLAQEGITAVCYNFMPLIDWTRTDLKAPVANGGTCLRFSAVKMAAFEIFMLGRDAANSYPDTVVQAAEAWFAASSESERETLLNAIMCGLPGAYDRYNVDELKTALATYAGLTRSDVRANFKRFLEEVIPTAQEHGIKLAVHPDDPPRDLFGLPRIVSSADDIAWILEAVPSPSNGLTLCTGSLGAGRHNDPVAIAERFAGHIHFVHLRNVRKEPDGSFEEAEHLGGDTDMVAVAKILIAENKRRKAAGEAALCFRPDHGHDLLSDAEKAAFPGYPLVGRMRGLAELRGVLHALENEG